MKFHPLIQCKALVSETVLQARRKKVLISLFVFVTLILVAYTLLVRVTIGEVDPSEVLISSPLFGIGVETVKIKEFADVMFAGFVLGPLTVVGFFLFILSFAGFIPENLRKGSADLLLSKPVPKWLVLLTKIFVIDFLGCLIAAYFFFGVLIIVWAKCGLYATEFIPYFLFVLLLYQPIVALISIFSVLSRSTVLVVIGSFAVYFLSMGLMPLKRIAFAFDPKWLSQLTQGLYSILPKFPEMISEILKSSVKMNNIETAPFKSSLIFSVVVILLSVFIFYRRTYTN